MPRISGALDIVQVSAPPTPQGGRSYLYFKSDGLLYSKDPGGTERQVGAGSAPTNMVTTDTTQTITGTKTFSAVLTGSAGIYDGANRAYSDSNPPQTFMQSESASAPATPAAGLGIQYVLTSDSWPRYINDSGQIGVMINYEPYIFSVTGALTVATGKSRVYLEGNYVIDSVRASVNTAPAGTAILVDVSLNGTTIFTTQANRPSISAGANTALANMGAGTITTISTGQYLTVDVDQIGTTTAGSDLTVVIRLRRI